MKIGKKKTNALRNAKKTFTATNQMRHLTEISQEIYRSIDPSYLKIHDM
jgi:hypothetical protein